MFLPSFFFFSTFILIEKSALINVFSFSRFSSLRFCLSFFYLPQRIFKLFVCFISFSANHSLHLLPTLSYPVRLTEMETILILQMYSPMFLHFLQASCYFPPPPLVSVLELLQYLPFSSLSLWWRQFQLPLSMQYSLVRPL